MIDLVLLRKETDRVLEQLKKKDPSYDGQRLVELDKSVRALRVEVENLRHEKKELSRNKGAGVSVELRDKSRALGETLKAKESELQDVLKAFNDLYLRCPNLLMSDVPAGNKEENRVVKEWGEKKTFSFTPKNHVELNDALQWFDLAAAAKMTGSNFVFYRSQAAKLMYALAMLMLKNNEEHGYSPVLPPYLVTEQSLEGAAQFPRFKDAVYAVPEDGLYLTPTAEVNLTNLHRDHIFGEKDLPERMTAWTSCFRREAGTYGATERGLIRIHQFEKVELYAVCTPEQAAKEHEKMLACAEVLLQKLGLHYRVSLLAAQDCSFASAKTYDLEVWMPGQKAYYEVSSSSNCTDFQARRCAMRYRDASTNKNELVHTLNTSSLALPRLIVAIMETYQQADGSIAFPDVLKNISIGV